MVELLSRSATSNHYKRWGGDGKGWERMGKDGKNMGKGWGKDGSNGSGTTCVLGGSGLGGSG